MRGWKAIGLGIGLGINLGLGGAVRAQADPPPALPGPRDPVTVSCDLLVAGGGFGGVAAAYEGLRLGKRVCMTEITDWIGGQVSAQGVSALDERPLQRNNDLFPFGYSEFRRRVRARYGGQPNPGQCWVSVLCFTPQDGHDVVREMLDPYLSSGQLQLFTDTVVKDVEVQGSLITQVQGLRHIPRRPELAGGQRGNLSEYFEDWYDPNPSADWDKEWIIFAPPTDRANKTLPWMVIDATETGELWPLSGVPYRVGTDVATRWEPHATSEAAPYCTQGFTYTFVMERTSVPQVPIKPPDYDYPEHGPYFSYELARFNFPMIFTYRRIRGQVPGTTEAVIRVGDQSMQNWTWGNDWRITGPDRNFILTHDQLEQSGQLEPGGWRGGLRVESLRMGERHARNFFYWLVAGTSDFLLQKEDPNFRKNYYLPYRYLQGADSPMGTASGLSRYPYIRESRRLIGRPGFGHPDGFLIYETDITFKESDLQRGRPFIFFDSVGIGQYPIDFHECILPDFQTHPLGNKAAESPSYPFQVPLRALIPQTIDNLLAGAKNIAATRIATAAYRVHPIEWAIGTGAAHTAVFSLDQDVIPAAIPDLQNPQLLYALQAQIRAWNNPIAFPGATITETEWANSK
ncbi:MAG: FAD-dependent oxidoreductase [Synechococcales cyanobacterium]